MNRKLFVQVIIGVLFLFTSIRSFAQIAISEENIAVIEGELIVKPALRLRDNAFKQSKEDPEPFTPDQTAHWLKIYNRQNKTDYLLLNQSIMYGKIVIVTPDRMQQIITQGKNYIPLPQDSLGLVSGDFSPYKGPENYVAREKLFLTDKRFKLPVYPQINFINTFRIPIARACMAYTTPSSGLLNGNVFLKFFGDDSSEVIGIYHGTMKDGYADGYGLFVTRSQNAKLGYARRGFWKKGIFQQEDEALTNADTIIKKILEGYVCDNLRGQIVEASFRRDILLPDSTNGFTLIIKVVWTDRYTGQSRFFIIDYSKADFYNQPLLSVISKDQFAPIPLLEIANPSSFSNMLGSAIRTERESLSGNTYKYDDYTQIYEQTPYSCNARPYSWEEEDINAYRPDPNAPLPKVTRYDNGYDKCNTILVSVREARGAEWKQVGKIEIVQVVNGTKSEADYPKYTVLIEPFMEHSFYNNDEKSNRAIVDEIMPVVRSKYPLPLNDTTLESKTKRPSDILGEQKYALLKERLRNDAYYHFNSKDSLHGAWELSDGNLVIIDNLYRKKAYSATEGLMGTSFGYQGGVHLEPLQHNGRRLTCILENKDYNIKQTLYDLTIKQLSTKSIQFETGEIWNRID